jgi:hypothetical protein
LGLHEKYPDKPFLVIKGRRQMKQLLGQWKDGKASETLRLNADLP